jgi:Ca2+-binding RTX toxin-like protein
MTYKLTRFETLESRRLLANFASVDISGTGTLMVEGTVSSDSVDIRFRDSDVVISLNKQETTFPRSSVSRLSVSCGSSDDFIINRTNLRSTLNGGEGNDTLIGGLNADTIVGGVGVNAIDGGIGLSTVDQSLGEPGGFGFSPDFEGDATRVVFASSRDLNSK